MNNTNDILFGWGDNEFGQLGIKGIDKIDNLTVSNINIMVNKIICGEKHTLILSKDGLVYSAGNNEYGQLGRKGPERQFCIISQLETKLIVDIACGSKHNLCMDNFGKIYGFGDNKYNQVSSMINESIIPYPKLVCSQIRSVIGIYCGYNCSFAYNESGKFFAWGCNDRGQIGCSSDNKATEFCINIINEMEGIIITKVCGGLQHCLALSSNGYVYSWGNNNKGQLGRKTIENYDYIPASIRNLEGLVITDICCGLEHSAVLIEDGRVFTFGCGQYGQLGHGSYTNQFNPRQVIDLAHVKISHISCGRDYTSVYSKVSNTIYGFGYNNSCQCLVSNIKKINSPVEYKILNDNNLKTVLIVSGSSHSFILKRSSDGNDENCTFKTKLLHIGEDNCCLTYDKFLEYTFDESTNNEMYKNLSTIFSSLSCINASFIRKSNCRWMRPLHNIDFEKINEFSTKHLYDEKLHTILRSFYVFIKGLTYYKYKPPETYRFVYIMLLFPINNLSGSNFILYELLENIFDWGNIRFLIQNFISLPPSFFENFVLAVKEEFVTILNKDTTLHNQFKESKGVDNITKNYLTIFENLYEFNLLRNLIHYSTFYIHNIENVYNIYDEYVQKSRDVDNSDSFPIYDLYFLFTTEMKAYFLLCIVLLNTVLSVYSSDQLTHLDSNNLHTLYNTVPRSQMFSLYVRRTHLVQDTFRQLVYETYCNMNMTISVTFVDEIAQDEGGVKKEFFLLLCEELFTPNSKLFYALDDRYLWFTDIDNTNESISYYFIGLVVALAVYNCTIIDLKFPLVFYAKLLSSYYEEMEMFQDFDPDLARGLQNLLDLDENSFNELGPITYQISRVFNGETRNINLIENGDQIELQYKDRHDYVKSVINYLLDESCDKLFQSILRGFYYVNVDHLKEMFNAYELRDLIIGCQNIDFIELRDTTEYKEPYNSTHPTILLFWDVLHSFDIDEKKRFLKFLTGSDKIPISGIGSLEMIINYMNSSLDHFPVSHTCFNTLDLPPYNTYEMMEQKLRAVLPYCHGFGLI